MGARLAELLGGLSLACDQANAFVPGKAQRTAIIAARLARHAGLSAAQARDAFYLSLLRYLGCVGFAHEESAIYGGGDDRALRNVMSLSDVADPIGTARAVVQGIAPGRPLGVRLGAIARLLGDPSAVKQHARAQCETSARLAALVGVEVELTASLRYLCERWDGRGEPSHAVAEEIPVAMRVHQIADVSEIAYHRGGETALRALLAARAGAQLDPALCACLLRELDEVLRGLDAPCWQPFLDAEGTSQVVLDDAGVDAVVLALARFTDLKSVFTLGHSESVAALAEQVAAAMALPPGERITLRRAALLHDLGRLSVSNAVWDHPGPLDPVAREQVRLHAYYTERVLCQSPPLLPLASIAAGAHERLEGSGYHRGVPAALIPRSARILAAADVARAMMEPRPHRPARSRAEVERALRDERRAGRLDPEVVDATLAALGVTSRSRGTTALTPRELDVLRHLARGKTNKEIGALLGISARTVQVHLAHAYDKAGVSTRAGAALYIVERGLLDAP